MHKFAALLLITAFLPLSAFGSRGCYDCNSYWDKCPINGRVNDEQASVTECSDMCFARIDYENSAKVVYRGCSAFFPLLNPVGGCHKIKGVTWCFCDTGKCNTQDLTKLT